MMQSELAAVRGIIALTPREVLTEAQMFLARQGYATVEVTDSSLIVQRLPHGYAGGALPSLTITAIPDPQGGVRVIVSGDDREGVQRSRDAWVEWSEQLPRIGDTQGVARNANGSAVIAKRQSATDLSSFSTATTRTVTVNQPSPRSTRRTMELIFGGAVAVLIIFAVLLFGLLMFVPMGSDDSAGSSDAGPSFGSESGGGGQETVAIGEPLNVSDVTWTVTNAQQVSELRQRGFGQFNESKQGNFVVVDFNFTNNANEAVTLDSMSLALVDGEGRKSETDTDTFGYVPAGKDIFLENVNPGITQQGQVIFTVAPGASDFRLEAGDTDMFSDEHGFVRLGF